MKRRQIMTGYNPYHWIDIKYCRQDMRRDGYQFVKSSRVKRYNRPALPNECRSMLVKLRIERLRRKGNANRWGFFDRYY